MIAELFYPKELKDAVSDLQVKGDINEKPLNTLALDIYFIGLFFLLLIIGLSYFLVSIFLCLLSVTIYLLIVFPVFSYFHAKRFYNKKLASYIHGKSRKGKIVKIYTRGRDVSRPVTDIEIKDLQNGNIHWIGHSHDIRLNKKYSFETGATVPYLLSDCPKHSPVIAIKDIAESYSLSQSVIKDKCSDG